MSEEDSDAFFEEMEMIWVMEKMEGQSIYIPRTRVSFFARIHAGAKKHGVKIEKITK